MPKILKNIRGEKRLEACMLITHYPEWLPKQKERVFRMLAKESHVVVLRRPIENIHKSLSTWGIAKNFEHYQELHNEYYHFWQEAAPNRLEFTLSELDDRRSFKALIPKIATEFNISPRRSVRYTVNARIDSRIAIIMLATRLFEKYTPAINDGVQSGMNSS